MSFHPSRPMLTVHLMVSLVARFRMGTPTNALVAVYAKAWEIQPVSPLESKGEGRITQLSTLARRGRIEDPAKTGLSAH